MRHAYEVRRTAGRCPVSDFTGPVRRVVDLAGGELGVVRELIQYEDGTWRFRHMCHRERDGRTLDVAPLLGEQHVVLVARMPSAPVTVRPSILCGDCGTHGWVESSTWVPA